LLRLHWATRFNKGNFGIVQLRPWPLL
jgi:hypothetical protein